MIGTRRCRTGSDQNPVTVCLVVLGQEATDLGLQVVVASAGGAEPRVALVRVEPDAGLEELADLSPTIRAHSSLLPS